MLDEHGQRFLEKCFTQAERDYCERSVKRRVEHYAGRFAAKEAALKVLGTGWRGGISWCDMEILPDPQGAPVLIVSGEAGQIATRLGITRWHVSITHIESHAMASVIGEK